MNVEHAGASAISVSGPVAVSPETGRPFRGAESPVGPSDPSVPELLAVHAFIEEEFFAHSGCGRPAIRRSWDHGQGISHVSMKASTRRSARAGSWPPMAID